MKGSRESLRTLRIFLSAARTLNFSRSAEQLHIDQSTVSKHILALERSLGIALFKRLSSGLELTQAGQLYLQRVGPALSLLDEAHAMVAPDELKGALNIAVSPSFAQYCLIPYLPDFFARYPSVRLNIRPRLLFEFRDYEHFDAAIQLHTGFLNGISTDYLCGREVSVVSALGAVTAAQSSVASQLAQMVLLKRAQRGYGWQEWKSQLLPEWPGPSQDSPQYEGFSMLLPAVKHGLGAALVPLCMVLPDLESGTLYRPFNECVTSRYSYYFMRPAARSYDPRLETFLGWLKQHFSEYNAAIQAYLRSAS